MIVLIAALVLAASVVVLFVLIVAGMHSEPPWRRLGPEPPSLLAALSRRVLGVRVRRDPRQDHHRKSDHDDAAQVTTSLGRR